MKPIRRTNALSVPPADCLLDKALVAPAASSAEKEVGRRVERDSAAVRCFESGQIIERAVQIVVLAARRRKDAAVRLPDCVGRDDRSYRRDAHGATGLHP